MNEQEVKQQPTNAERLAHLLEDRTAISLLDLIDQFGEGAGKTERQFMQLLLSRQDYVKDCTIILGRAREAKGAPGTSLLERKTGSNGEIIVQVVVNPYRRELEMTNWEMKIVSVLRDSESLFHIAAHELAHTFTTYILTANDEILNQEEYQFLQVLQDLHRKYIEENKHSIGGDRYISSINEFAARTLTAGEDTIYFKYREKLFTAFKKMYKNNSRRIVSLSLWLQENE